MNTAKQNKSVVLWLGVLISASSKPVEAVRAMSLDARAKESHKNRLILGRKRKRNNNYNYTEGLLLNETVIKQSPHLSRNSSISSIPLTKPKTPLSFLRKKEDWTKNSPKNDAASEETGDFLKFLSGFASGLFKKSIASLKDKFKAPPEDDPSIANGLKKRKIEEKTIEVKDQEKEIPLRKTLLETNFQPELNPKDDDVKFGKSPIDWNLEKQVTTGSKDYGTKFIRRSKAYKSTNIESAYLRSVYKGQYKPPKPRSTSPPTPKVANDNRLLSNIRSLTETIRKNWSDSSQTPESEDDVVFLKEVKIVPPTPSRFSFAFDTSKLTFDEEFKYYQKLLDERKKLQEQIHKEKLEATKPRSTLIEKVSTEDEAAVLDIWKAKDADGIVLTAYSIDVTVKDFQTLADKHWLNDTVIELFLKTLTTDKVYGFSSFFFTNLAQKGYIGVKKWLKRGGGNIAKLETIIVPINVHQTHWVLGAIKMKEKKVIYLDSLATSKTPFSERALDHLELYVREEAKKQGVPELGQGFTKQQILDCPQQQNGYDCGVFTLMNALHLAKGESLTYQPSDATQFRRVIASTILKLPPSS